MSLAEILNEAQHSFAGHRKQIIILKKLQGRNPSQFFEDFCGCLDHVLLVFKREPAVERIVSFMVSFATFQSDGMYPVLKTFC
jgi:condensin complex subunit 3